ncbi:MAG: hypothetical protein DRP08_01385 [Candidatus Aenigmatarchaeota archaeon]|nr:MAG: hypothetical protein DRP08_01385 [Candidatus Aenigmarchaeota archaeon]
MQDKQIATKSPLCIVGGKFYLANKILPYFPPHHHYIEVFGGAAQILFRKRPSPIETYNDINSLVVNFFRVLRDYPDQLYQKLNATPYSREEFECCKRLLYSATTNNIDKAFAFFVLNQQGFSGHDIGKKKVWAYIINAQNSKKASQFRNKVKNLYSFSKRLKKVQIEHLHFEKLFKRYKRAKDALFYCDPPYIGVGEELYSHSMTEEEHKKLITLLLTEMKEHKIILSGLSHKIYQSLEKEGWERVELINNKHALIKGKTIMRTFQEYIWISPECYKKERSTGREITYVQDCLF